MYVCVYTLQSGARGEGTGGFKAFDSEEDRPRSLSPRPGGFMAEQGRVGSTLKEARVPGDFDGSEHPVRRTMAA